MDIPQLKQRLDAELEIETFFVIPYNPESSDDRGIIYQRFKE